MDTKTWPEGPRTIIIGRSAPTRRDDGPPSRISATVRGAERHGVLMLATSLRHGALFAAMTGLGLLVLYGPAAGPHPGGCLARAAGIAAAALAAGWLCRGRRPAAGGWIAGGATAAVLLLSLTAPLAVALERHQVEAGQAGAEVNRTGRIPSTPLAVEVDRAIEMDRHLDRRAEEAWDRSLPLILALAPSAFLGTLGTHLGDRRRARRVRHAARQEPLPRRSGEAALTEPAAPRAAAR